MMIVHEVSYFRRQTKVNTSVPKHLPGQRSENNKGTFMPCSISYTESQQ